MRQFNKDWRVTVQGLHSFSLSLFRENCGYWKIRALHRLIFKTNNKNQQMNTKQASDMGTVTNTEVMTLFLTHKSAFVQIVLAELSQWSLLQDLWVLLAYCRSVTLWPSKTARAAAESRPAAKPGAVRTPWQLPAAWEHLVLMQTTLRDLTH